MAGIMDDMELSQALRAIKDKYNVVIGVWTREDAVNAILINKGLEDDDEGVAEAERLADTIWTSDFRHGLDEVANDPNEFFQDMVRMELQTHGLD
jgi:CBS domain containing-hemolysin-like protein